MNITMAFSICSLFYLILIAIVYFKKQRVKNIETNIYTILISVTIIGILIEIFSAIINNSVVGFDDFKTVLLKLIINFFFTWLFVFTTYIFLVSTKKTLNNKSINMLLTFYVIVNIIILLLPIYKEMDGNIVLYTYGPSISILYIAFLISTVLSVLSLIKNYKNLGSKKYIPIYVFFALGIIVVLIQTLNPSLLLLASLDAFITVLMYHTIENPDVRMLEELAKAQKLSQNTNNDKSNFLYNITNVVTSGLDKVDKIASTTIESKTKEEVIKNMNELKSIVNKSRVFVKQTIDISNMDTANLKLVNNKYNVRNLIESIFKSKTKDVSDKVELRLNISENIPNELYGDSIKIKQIIITILDNSIKYTKKGFIEIRVNTIIKNNICRLLIAIEDSGSGIDIYKQNEIMNNHSSLTKDDLKVIDNQNLNLKLVKKMISAIGGSFIIESNESKGTLVSISIDQQISSDEKTSEEKQLEDYSLSIEKKKSIAIVSTNSLLVKTLKSICKKKDYNFNDYDMTKKLLDEIRNNELFDMIFIDKDMDKINAVSFLKKAKMVDNYSSKTIVISDTNDEEVIRYLLNIGFSKVIKNNILKKDLEKLID